MNPVTALSGEDEHLFLPADPLGEDLPIRVVLRRELPTSGVKCETACLGRERLQQKPALVGITRDDQGGNYPEIAPRLLLGPRNAPGRKLLQPKGTVAIDMANVAPGMTRPLFQKDRLDLTLVNVII